MKPAVKITDFDDARAAFAALYEYLGEEYCTHPERCRCDGCQACSHAADGGTLMDRLISVRDAPKEDESPDPQQEGHGTSYYAWRENQRLARMGERNEM